MTPRQKIAEIIRKDISVYMGNTIIRRATDNLHARERLAERRGIAKGLLIALAIIAGCLLLRKEKSIYPVLTPEQQMEDTIQISTLPPHCHGWGGWARISVDGKFADSFLVDTVIDAPAEFSHPIQEDSFSTH